MKRILILLVLVLLTACNGKQEKQLSVVCPSGAPSLAFYSEIENKDFATATAANIIPELKGENGSDIIVIDTVNGIKALNDGSNYKIAATITFGNFYIASTGNDDNGIMDEGDYIVLFSQGATPDLLFHYLFGEKFDENIHYVNAVTEASACLISGTNIYDENGEARVDYVMIAEPALSVGLTKNENAKIYENLQESYQTKTDMVMMQASVFVSNKLSDKQISEYLDSLEQNINNLLQNPDLFKEACADLSDDEVKDIFGVPNANVATKVLKSNTIGLGYKKAYENKKDIDSFINLFGMAETDEEIYFK